MLIPDRVIILTVDADDNAADVLAAFSGSESLYAVVEGRDPVADGDAFARYVLRPSLLVPGAPELSVQVWVGFTAATPATIKNACLQTTSLLRTWTFGKSTMTRAEVRAHLRREAVREAGARFVWEITPTTDRRLAPVGEPGDLASKFTPVTAA